MSDIIDGEAFAAGLRERMAQQDGALAGWSRWVRPPVSPGHGPAAD